MADAPRQQQGDQKETQMAVVLVQQQGVPIEKLMVDAFEGEFHHSDAIVGQAKKYVESLKFDHFDENITYKVMRGIQLQHFERVVDSIVTSHDISHEKRDEILTGQFMDDNKMYLHTFTCPSDGRNKFRYGAVVTKLNNGKMDMAYSVYDLAFIFPLELPQNPNGPKEFKLFGYTLASWGSKQSEPKAKVLSQSNQNLLKVYFEAKALEPFKCKRQYRKAVK